RATPARSGRRPGRWPRRAARASQRSRSAWSWSRHLPGWWFGGVWRREGARKRTRRRVEGSGWSAPDAQCADGVQQLGAVAGVGEVRFGQERLDRVLGSVALRERGEQPLGGGVVRRDGGLQRGDLGQV